MPVAQLKSATLSHSSVDDTTGVISGCKLMQVGKVATFKGADGKMRSFEVTPELIRGLIGHAGNRSIPAHFTHDYTNGEKDSLHARLGVHKNVREDADGDLASDLHTMPNEYGKLALWTAKTDPSSAAFSAVFSYNPIKDGERNLAVPLDFQAADLVAKGAACAAMLSQTQTDTDTMTEPEFDTMLAKSPSFTKALGDAITAALAKFTPQGFITKADSDAAITAALAAHKPVVSDDDKKSIALLASAETIKTVGATGGFIKSLSDTKECNEYTAKLAKYQESAPNTATAIARLLKDNPHLNSAREDAVRAQLSNSN